MTTIGNDGIYATSAVMGAMARMCIGYGSTPEEAENCLSELLEHQEHECYHHEQAMSHLADIQPYGVQQWT